jgi:bifunctional non-homologous end joining protein LigD
MLNTYRIKRDFNHTQEPPPRKEPGRAGLRFVVQKHWARNLHYDFRLEHEGVLKSWAVPKGFSLDPQVKRLAVQVEDHPYAYLNFKGRIPEGHYGAGEVMLWDQGTYVPVNGSAASKPTAHQAVAAALAKGHLDFALFGQKLHGQFTLVRMHDNPKQWLLIKKHDGFAEPNAVFDEKPVPAVRAVKRELRASRTTALPALLAGLDLAGAKKSPLPAAVQPMLATLATAPFDAEHWIFEVKWDGFRSLAEIQRGRVRLFSRNHKPQTLQFPAVVAGLRKLQVDAVLDGEIVAVDPEGRVDFQALQNYLHRGEGEAIYYVFDILSVAGLDIRPLPLRKRKAVLAKILPISPVIRLSVSLEKSGKAFYRAARENDLEGIVAKNLESGYLSGGRSLDWLKIKAQQQQEAVICGFTQPRASRQHFGALILGVYQDRKLVFAGHVGTGFNESLLAILTRKLKPLITRNCPFGQVPKTNMPVTWVKPQLICQVKFLAWTQAGSLRLPVFLGLREDVKPSAVVRETPVRVKPKAPEVASLQPTRALLTNLDKVFWPGDGTTKKDVILYYDRMAKWMLPFLKNRPQSLNRQPNGISEPGFFQKNFEAQTPAWVKTAEIFSEHTGHDLRYLLCQNRDTLLFLANLGCIELNVWDSSWPHLDKPDFMVLDFDPVKPGLPHLISAVQAMKKLLDQIGLPGFVKTSGGRGLHVYVPLLPRFGYEDVREFAHLLMSIIARRHPGLLAKEREPGARRGLVYLDYPQNRYGATMAAPYSLRPRPGAPVSAPLAWKEVTPQLDPLAFNLRTMPGRVARLGDLWKDIFKQRADLGLSLPKVEKIIAGKA